MSVVRVANTNLFKTLATEEDEPFHAVTYPAEFDTDEPLPIEVLDLMIKRGMTTYTSDRYNPAIASPFSQSVLNRMRKEYFRLRTLSYFRIKDKKLLTNSCKMATTGKKTFFLNTEAPPPRVIKPILRQTLKPPPIKPIDTYELPKLERLDVRTIDQELELYQHRKHSRVSRIFERKYSRQWKRQYFG